MVAGTCAVSPYWYALRLPQNCAKRLARRRLGSDRVIRRGGEGLIRVGGLGVEGGAGVLATLPG
jgi:hypothetical protein